jgi:hypothetical protein
MVGLLAIPHRKFNFELLRHPLLPPKLLLMNQYKRCSAVLLLFTLLQLTQSCSTTKIVTRYDCNTVANNPVNKKTTWTFAWGLVQPKDIDPKCETAANYLNKVVVKTNLGFILLSAVTLGVVIPQRVEWCCSPQDIRTDTLGRRP